VASPYLAGGEAGAASHFAKSNLAEHGRRYLCQKSVSVAKLAILLTLDFSSECHAGSYDLNRSARLGRGTIEFPSVLVRLSSSAHRKLILCVKTMLDAVRLSCWLALGTTNN
jgi:hypothetical protein